MVISFIKDYWIILAFLPVIIYFIIAFKNYRQKSRMSITITSAIGLAIYHFLLSLSLFWYMQVDLLSFLCILGFGLIFIMIYVLASWINDQLFGDFYKKLNYAELFSFENKHKKRHSEIIKEKENNNTGEGL